MNEQWASETGLPFIEDSDEWDQLSTLYSWHCFADPCMPVMIEYALKRYGIPKAMRWIPVDGFGMVLGVIN